MAHLHKLHPIYTNYTSKSNGFTTIGISEPAIEAMADVTLFTNLQKSQQQLVQLLQSDIKRHEAAEMKIQEHTSGMDKKFDHISQILAEIQLQFLHLSKKHVSSEENNLENLEHTPDSASMKIGSSPNYAHSPTSRIDFPRFDGTNPRAWIFQCSRYFKLMPNVPDAQKINLAIKHFDGKALMWYQNFNMGEIEITWEQFLEVVCARFEDLRLTNIIMELNKLKQNGTYDDYVERFDELKACLVLDDSSEFTEEFFIDSFLSGLDEELQSFINMFQPKTLHHTIELGRKQLVTLDVISKKLHQPDAQSSSSLACYGIEEPTPQGRLKPNANPEPPTKLLMAVEMSAQREKELCYYCDESYVLGHKCQTRVSYLMRTEEEFFAAQRAIELRIPEVESNMDQTVKEVHQFWKLVNAQEDTNKKGDIPPDLIPKLEKNVAIFEEQAGMPPARGMENHIKLKFGSLPMHQNEFNQFSEEMLRRCLGKKYIHVEYANMLFTATLKGARVTLQALPNEPFLTNLTHEGITDFGDIFIEETATEHDKSTILLRVFTETSTIGEENGKTQFGVGDMVSLKFHPLHLPFVFRIGKEIVPMLQYCEDAAAGASVLGTRVVTGKVNTILQNFEGIPLGIMLVAESGVAFLGCKTQTFVHELSKIEPLLVMGTHILNREDKKFGQMLLHGLNMRLESAIWELTQFLRRKISPFNPCGQGSFEAGGIVMALVKEKGEEVEVEVAGGKEKKLGRKADLGKKVGDVFELEKKVGGWLISESAFAMSRDLDLISRKLPSLDPRGRGSSAARGIVISGDSEKYEGLIREYELGMI